MTCATGRTHGPVFEVAPGPVPGTVALRLVAADGAVLGPWQVVPEAALCWGVLPSADARDADPARLRASLLVAADALRDDAAIARTRGALDFALDLERRAEDLERQAATVAAHDASVSTCGPEITGVSGSLATGGVLVVSRCAADGGAL